MAHFAQLDENNIVTQVIVVSNDDIKDSEGNESELTGIAFCKSLLGPNTIWKQTSYNNSIRKNYAGIGFTYDATRDAFYPPKPYNSWILNELTCIWESPVAYPNDEKMYVWDEETTSWVSINNE
jgi:hypothetical protein